VAYPCNIAKQPQQSVADRGLGLLKISCLEHILDAVDVESMPNCIEYTEGILPFQQFLEQLGDTSLAVGLLGLHT